MPTWGKILEQIQTLRQNQPDGIAPTATVMDVVRRQYLAKHRAITGRNVILYASKWTHGDSSDPLKTMMTVGDMDGFMNAIQGLEGDGLDLILHLPGGQAEAAERIGKYLRTRFSSIRVFVPLAAMSAATMLACVADSIVMGKHSCLGPIDPQFVLRTEGGVRAMPAHAILAQFAKARVEIATNPMMTNVWLPLLRQLDPAILVECEYAQELAQSVVSDWLSSYMLANNVPQATAIAKQLGHHPTFLSHSRYIDRKMAASFGLVIDNLETNPDLQDAVLSTYHCIAHTFNASSAVKIVENHNGMAWVQHVTVPQKIAFQFAPAEPPVPPPAAEPSVPPPAAEEVAPS